MAVWLEMGEFTYRAMWVLFVLQHHILELNSCGFSVVPLGSDVSLQCKSDIVNEFVICTTHRELSPNSAGQ